MPAPDYSLYDKKFDPWFKEVCQLISDLTHEDDEVHPRVDNEFWRNRDPYGAHDEGFTPEEYAKEIIQGRR